MQFDGALIREQGVEFAIVIVKSHVIQSTTSANAAKRSFGSFFPGVPIVLMAQDYRGTPTYYGRRDIVDFLANTNPSRIPWQRFTFSG